MQLSVAQCGSPSQVIAQSPQPQSVSSASRESSVPERDGATLGDEFVLSRTDRCRNTRPSSEKSHSSQRASWPTDLRELLPSAPAQPTQPCLSHWRREVGLPVRQSASCACLAIPGWGDGASRLWNAAEPEPVDLRWSPLESKILHHLVRS